MKRLLHLLSLSLIMNISVFSNPNISFFCELQGKEFNDFFADSALINELVEMHATLRIGLHDFSAGRTLAIQKLNAAGIPVVAWLLLPEEDGYWFNMHNGDKAAKRYEDFREWSLKNNLKWEGIGIDLEPDMNDGKLIFSHPWKLAWRVYKRLYDNKSLKEAKGIYQELITRMKNDGFKVESYLIPFIYDERELKTTSLQKLLGIVDIETDVEIPMLYTSALGNSGIIPLYHHDNMPVALGSTGGGVKINGAEIASLTWPALEKDLLIANALTNDIHIFSLEGSVEKGYLSHIRNLNFSQDVPDISSEIKEEKSLIKKVRFLLVILDHPFLLTIVIMTVAGSIIFLFFKLVKLVLRLLNKKKI